MPGRAWVAPSWVLTRGSPASRRKRGAESRTKPHSRTWLAARIRQKASVNRLSGTAMPRTLPGHAQRSLKSAESALDCHTTRTRQFPSLVK